MGIINETAGATKLLQQAVKKLDETIQQNLLTKGEVPFSLKYKEYMLQSILETQGKKIEALAQQGNDYLTKQILIITNTVAEEDISPYLGEVQFSPDPSIPMIFQMEDYINGNPIEAVDWSTLTASADEENTNAVQIVERVKRVSGQIEMSVGVVSEYDATDLTLIKWLEENGDRETERIANRMTSIKNAQIVSTVYKKAVGATIQGSPIVIDQSIVQTEDGYRKTLIDIRNTISITADQMAETNKTSYPNVLLIPMKYKTYIREAYKETFQVLKHTPTMLIAQFDEYVGVFHKINLGADNEKIVMLVNNDDVQSIKFAIPNPLTFEMELNDARTLTYIRSIKHIYSMYFYKPQYFLATIPLKYVS